MNVCFNSSLVRLGEQTRFKPLIWKCVSIPAWCDWEYCLRIFAIHRLHRFNSSLVRLGVICQQLTNIFIKFQFQLGAIGRICFYQKVYVVFVFQFQLGAIGSRRRQKMIDLMLGFNSSLVRLGVGNKFVEQYQILFQFQLGAIGSVYPTKVIAGIEVSIPAWCDWEPFDDPKK